MIVLDPISRGYGGVDGIGQGSSHLVDDRKWQGHTYYGPLHRGSTSYDMQHKRTKYSVLQVHQREGRCQGDAPWPVYKQRKNGPAERSKMMGRKVGIQQKRRQNILALGRTSIDILVEDNKVCLSVLGKAFISSCLELTNGYHFSTSTKST